jgi:hypothetical protein
VLNALGGKTASPIAEWSATYFPLVWHRDCRSEARPPVARLDEEHVAAGPELKRWVVDRIGRRIAKPTAAASRRACPPSSTALNAPKICCVCKPEPLRRRAHSSECNIVLTQHRSPDMLRARVSTPRYRLGRRGAASPDVARLLHPSVGSEAFVGKLRPNAGSVVHDAWWLPGPRGRAEVSWRQTGRLLVVLCTSRGRPEPRARVLDGARARALTGRRRGGWHQLRPRLHMAANAIASSLAMARRKRSSAAGLPCCELGPPTDHAERTMRLRGTTPISPSPRASQLAACAPLCLRRETPAFVGERARRCVDQGAPVRRDPRHTRRATGATSRSSRIYGERRR